MRLPWSRAQPALGVLDIGGSIDEAKALEVLMVLRDTDWHRKNIKVLMLRVSSNGGSLGAAQAICEGIETVRGEIGLLTLSLITETALSAAFYVALASDEVIATPAATVGNAGAMVGNLNGSALADKLGISFDPVRTGIGKGILHPLAKRDPASEHMLQGLVDDVAAQYFDWVGRRTGISDSALETLKDGRLLSGKQAAALGLIGSCGGFFSAIARASEHAGVESVAVIWLNPSRPSVLSRLAKGVKALF